MPTTERAGRRKRELKNLIKRGGIWYFKKEVEGRITKLTLDTADLEIAKARRSGLLKKVASEKWAEIDGLNAKRTMATVGEVIERFLAAKDLQLSPDTMNDYCWAVRRILKCGAGGRPAGDIDQLPVSVLDGAVVRAWQQCCLARVTDGDKLKLDTAAVTANSIVAQARSLFSKRALARNIYAGLTLPDLKGFLTAPSLQVLKRDGYIKPADEMIVKIWAGARKLRDGAERVPAEGPPWQRPLLWLVFYLASQTGLRKSELSGMRYGWFDGDVVRVKFETDFVAKGKRERPVPVAPSVEAECRRVATESGWPAGAEDYVLPHGAHGVTRPTAMEELFRELGAWMTEQGWTRRQKAHELRKIFASDLTEVSDPYDTQLALGHRDIKTTMRYAARRKVVAVDQAARYSPVPV